MENDRGKVDMRLGANCKNQIRVLMEEGVVLSFPGKDWDGPWASFWGGSQSLVS